MYVCVSVFKNEDFEDFIGVLSQAKALLEKESLTDDVEKEFPLLEPDLQPEEVQKEEVLAELTPEMEDEIDSALRPSPSGEELVRGFKLQLTRGDMQTLKGLNWLNDEVKYSSDVTCM